MTVIATNDSDRKPDSISEPQKSKFCEQCGKPFEPRSRSGGEPQRFCSTPCRRAFRSNTGATSLLDATAQPPPPPPSNLPVVFEPPPIEKASEPAEDKFDWVADDSIVLRYQPAVAVYISQGGNLVIRQERQWDEDSDTIICIAPESIDTFIDKLTDTAGIPSVGR